MQMEGLVAEDLPLGRILDTRETTVLFIISRNILNC